MQTTVVAWCADGARIRVLRDPTLIIRHHRGNPTEDVE
jgi:hypothetical protein